MLVLNIKHRRNSKKNARQAKRAEKRSSIWNTVFEVTGLLTAKSKLPVSYDSLHGGKKFGPFPQIIHQKAIGVRMGSVRCLELWLT